MIKRVCLIELDDHIVIVCSEGQERAALAAFSESSGMRFELLQVEELEAAMKEGDRHWGFSPQRRTAYYLTADGGFTFPHCFRHYPEADAVDVLQGWKERRCGGRVFRHREAPC